MLQLHFDTKNSLVKLQVFLLVMPSSSNILFEFDDAFHDFQTVTKNKNNSKTQVSSVFLVVLLTMQRCILGVATSCYCFRSKISV